MLSSSIFGVDAALFKFLMPLSSGNLVQCRYMWNRHLRILWCSFCTRQFCWCHYLRFFGVNFVQGMSFLMPLSSEKLVSFFVQGAFCDATIFGFLVLNVSMNRFFWCHYLRILWYSFCSRHFFHATTFIFFGDNLVQGCVFDTTIYLHIWIFWCQFAQYIFWCHYLRSLWC